MQNKYITGALRHSEPDFLAANLALDSIYAFHFMQAEKVIPKKKQRVILPEIRIIHVVGMINREQFRFRGLKLTSHTLPHLK